MKNIQEIVRDVRETHDDKTASSCYKIKNIYVRIARAESRRVFLLKHRQIGACPRFIRDKAKPFHTLRSKTTKHLAEINRAQESFERDMINIEIYLSIENINVLYKERNMLCNTLESSINPHTYKSLITCMNEVYGNTRDRCKIKHIQKLQKNVNKTSTSSSIVFNDDFCVNVSGREVPTEVTKLMGLGQCFAIPIKREEAPIMDLLAETDDIINQSSSDNKTHVRTLITNDYVQYLRQETTFNKNEKYIRHLHKKTNEFLRENHDIYVVNSDKGQKTVIMTKDMYETKMLEHLNDKNTYVPIPNASLKLNETLKRRTNNLIEELYIKGQLSQQEKVHLSVTTCIPPRIYGTFKTHKPNLPIRPVMSTINTATRRVCDKLQWILSRLPPDTMDVKNSDVFKDRITNINITDDEECLSLDVVSLYTNINQKDAIESCMRRWDRIQAHTTLSKMSFRRLLELCIFESGFFMYGNTFYKQIQGLPMGNPLSGTLAAFVLNDFLHDFFKSNKPTLLCKYVDDMFLIMNKHEIDPMMSAINQAHPTLKFTIEREKQRKIAFLDVTVIRENNTVHTNWYRKEISSGRILNFMSSHPYNMKRNVATAFAKRVTRLSHERYQKQNFKIIERTLANNNYPKTMIKRIINNIRYNDTSNQVNTNTTNDPPLTTQEVSYRGIPYVPVLSDKIRQNLKRLDDNIVLGMRPPRKLQHLFTKTKTKVKQKRKGFCYMLQCKGSNGSTCDKRYIGETGREDGTLDDLPPRIKEHRSSYKRAKTEKVKTQEDRQIMYDRLRTRSKQQQLQKLQSEHHTIDQERNYNNAALDHAMKTGHEFEYERFRILHYSEHYRKRKALEAMYIHTHRRHSINYKVDTQYMNSNTKQVLDVREKTCID